MRVILALVMLSLSCQNAIACGEKEMLSATKDAAASQIEEGLPSIAFTTWISERLGATNTNWEINDCGEQTGLPNIENRDYPLSVDVVADLQTGNFAFVRIYIGTFSKCAEGPPKLSRIELWSSSDPSDHSVLVELKTLNALGELFAPNRGEKNEKIVPAAIPKHH